MILRFVCFAILAIGVFSSAPARAVEPSKIAIVDVEKILAESKAAQSLQKQLQTKKEAFQKEFSDKEKDLKATETTLVAEQAKLPAEEFAKKRKAYEEKILEARKLYQKSRNALDQGLAKSMQELRKNIVSATAEVAQEKTYDVVLTRESVLIAEKALDITPDVLKKLDQKITTIPLKVE